MKPFSGKKQNLLSWDYSAQVPDYQDFQIIGLQVKGILLYFFISMCLKTYFPSQETHFKISHFSYLSLLFHDFLPHHEVTVEMT
jgi:hypothetical protein